MPHKEPTAHTLDDVCRLLTDIHKTIKIVGYLLIGFFIGSAVTGWGMYVAW